MSALHDRQLRGYCRFLLCFAALLAALGFGLCAAQARAVKTLYLAHSRAVAAALLAQGVPKEVAARALTSAGSSAAGDRLLESLGIGEDTAAGLLPLFSAFRRSSFLAAGGLLLLLILLLFGGTALFFRRRERLLRQAGEVLSRYLGGDYAGHLPQDREGALFQLFGSVEQLATMLQSQNEAERRSKEFLKRTLSDISHQLKTPLAALVLYHEILESEPDRPETVRACAARSGAALQRMERLIQSLLKLARLDAGSIAFDRRPCPMGELAACALSELTLRAEAEGKTLLVEGDPAQTLACDREWTGEALENLVKNALDHTERGGVIRLVWERRPALFCITVSDDGAGIAPEDIHHIFKRFYRSRNAPDSAGVGLGLALTRSIVEGQGGFVSVQSEPGEGAAFTLSFLTES